MTSLAGGLLHPAHPGGGGLPPAPAPRWELSSPPDPAAVEALVESLRLPRPLCRVLVVRGHGEVEAARDHLRPRVDHLHPPGALADAPAAADRIVSALRAGETILVHGDYDVDGVAATALLTRWLRHLGGRVVPFVPHRLRDGYDLGEGGLRQAREVGATLLVTVDSGIVAHAAVARAVAAGIDVIVTDHHTPGPTLPPALAVVNPNRADCTYPTGGLCGAGVVFKLCQLLAERLGRPLEELLPLLDLVALATVADLVPLSGENRILVRYGLRALRDTTNPGLRALLAVASVSGEIEAGQVGFRVAPRINAAGRMGDSADALELLLTDDPAAAQGVAGELDRLNRQRQEEEGHTLEAALAQLSGGFVPERDHGVVLAGEGWHPGVIGIVASRVVERIHRPVVMVALEGDRGRGSARSIPGFHLYEAVAACSEHLDRFGGHRQAAGMDVRPGALGAFREAFAREASRRLSGGDLRPVLRLDAPLSLAEVDAELVRYLPYLGPFGIGNPRPAFVARGVELVGAPQVLKGEHLKVRMRQDGALLEGIGFRMAGRVPAAVLEGAAVDVAFQVEEDEWRGVRRIRARLLDLRPAGAEGNPHASPAPVR